MTSRSCSRAFSEGFRLLVLADASEQRRYAYVVHGRAGKVALLFPHEDEPLHLQEGMQRIPEGSDGQDDAFFLDGESGLEHLVLVSSRAPLNRRAVERIAEETLQRRRGGRGRGHRAVSSLRHHCGTTEGVSSVWRYWGGAPSVVARSIPGR